MPLSKKEKASNDKKLQELNAPALPVGLESQKKMRVEKMIVPVNYQSEAVRKF